MTDQGYPTAQKATVSLVMTVKRTADIPTFSKSENMVTVSESLAVNDSVASVTASMEDPLVSIYGQKVIVLVSMTGW